MSPVLYQQAILATNKLSQLSDVGSIHNLLIMSPVLYLAILATNKLSRLSDVGSISTTFWSWVQCSTWLPTNYPGCLMWLPNPHPFNPSQKLFGHITSFTLIFNADINMNPYPYFTFHVLVIATLSFPQFLTIFSLSTQNPQNNYLCKWTFHAIFTMKKISTHTHVHYCMSDIVCLY